MTLTSKIVDENEANLPFFVTEESDGRSGPRYTVRDHLEDGTDRIVGITGFMHYGSLWAAQMAARKAKQNKIDGGTYQCPI